MLALMLSQRQRTFTADLPEEGVLAILPNASALQASSIAVKEWLGLLVYRFRGWA